MIYSPSGHSFPYRLSSHFNRVELSGGNVLTERIIFSWEGRQVEYPALRSIVATDFRYGLFPIYNILHFPLLVNSPKVLNVGGYPSLCPVNQFNRLTAQDACKGIFRRFYLIMGVICRDTL